MKKYWFLLIGLIILFSSCKKFLDLQPQFQLSTASFYKSQGDFETAIVGAYSELQGLYASPMIYLGELTTDNAYIQWTSPTTSEQELDQMLITPSNNFVGSAYSTNFRIVMETNAILDQIDGTSLQNSMKERYKGEAKFLRALAYFNLVRLFGDVPLINVNFKSPSEIQSFDMTRQPVDQVYDLIITDLQQTIVHLQGITNLSKSRASVGAAKTLLGKVYLTIHKYPEALTELGDVISSNKYSLQPNYATLFTNKNDELPESIFEVKYLSGNIGEGNSFSSLFTPASFNAAIFPNNMNGSGRILPTKDLIDSYEPDDVRRKLSIMDSLKLLDGSYDKIPYGLKMVDFTVGIPGDGGINYIPLRYADVLLMYAEALNETNKISEAFPYINLVRKRADLGEISGLSQEELRLAIERERRVEFLEEGHRWFDLIRTGRAISVINNYYANNGLNFSVTEYKLLMPIPLREINIDPNMEQNPGY